MAMLAERKRKQKWSLNPRGKAWAQDANKFGQKMLEKMGWEQGKGLGAKEDGITEHVKVSYKNDSRGMGYKETNDQWTEHETNFTALLESLAGKVEKPDEIKLQSLEKKSESSRARVHYHKFTRGKDLSRYSEKDLANIFGKKSLKDSKKNDVNSEPVGGDAEKLEKESKFLVNAGSMKDYFKKKLPTFGKSNGYVVGSNGVLTKGGSDSESDIRPSFSFNGTRDTEESNQYAGFGFKSAVKEEETNKISFVSYINEENDKKKKKKKRKVEEIEDTTPKKKPKKDVGDKSKNDVLGLSNPAFNPLCTPVKVEKHILATIEETFSEDIEENSAKTVCNGIENSTSETGLEKHKKKKKKKKIFSGIDNSNFEESSPDSNSQRDQSSVEEIQKKKKKKEELCIENPSFNVSSEDSTYVSIETEENPYEVQVRVKKKKKKAKLALENPCFNESEMDSVDVSSENNAYELKSKKKKKEESKMKKKKKDSTAVENPCFNASLEESTETIQAEENPYEVKKKKKKKASPVNAISDGSLVDPEPEENSYEIKRKKKKAKEEMAIENPCFDSLNDSQELSLPSEAKKDLPFEVERKKKSKKNKEERQATSTEIEEIALPDVVESDLMLNIVTTPILSKQTMGNGEETLSITKVTGVKRRKSVRFSDVTQERIIPNNDELRSLNDIADRNELFDINVQVLNRSLEEESRGEKGLDNMAFDRQRNRMEENLDSISRTLDRYQAEIENDMNEQKLETFTMDDVMVGEVGNPHGENERLAEGTKLKFKYAHFSSTNTPFYHVNKVGPRKGYRHLIKGDIVVKFNNTNLHQIDGYGVKSKSAVA